MKRFLTIMLAGLLIVAVTAPAIAWEFNMKGEFEHRFRYLGRTGENDLLGRTVPYNSGLGFAPVAAGAVPGLYTGQFNEAGFSGPNIYGHPSLTAVQAPAPIAALAPMRIVAGGFSATGSDALYNDTRLTFYPEIRVNPAIRVHGTYTVGGYRNKFAQPLPTYAGSIAAYETVGVPPLERYYAHQTSDFAYNTAAIGSWEQFRATIQHPWGIWSIGVKDFPFGLGSTLGYNTRAESFLWVVPYGPFRFLWPIWLARSTVPANLANWRTNPDGSHKHMVHQAFAMQYLNGDLDIGGGLVNYQNYHIKAADEVTTGPTATAWNNGRRGYDFNTATWGAYVKYNNGRFFFNAEYMFTQTNTTPAAIDWDVARPLVGTAGFNSVKPSYAEAYHWFVELGAMAGPSRVTLMAATASGPVLNYENPTKVYTADAINYQAMQPYEWLMFNTYGGGNDNFYGDGYGQMSDAFCYAARLDYAVASNLNVWASYIWAHRLEKQGYLFGGKTYTGVPATNNDTSIQTFAANAGRFVGGAPQANVGGVPVTTYGYATDGYLGWEANAGVDWKLLEGMTMYFRYAYWQPGDWFKEAYQTKGWSNGTWNVNSPLETRDAINAFHGSIMIDF